MIKLDYNLTSIEERKQLVDQIISNNPNLNNKYLEILADYLINCVTKQERQQKKILTDNRMVTINKRECSFDKLVDSLETGESGIHSLIKEDKNIIFQPKISISKKDLEEIPFLPQIKESIEGWRKQLNKSSGKEAFICKKAIIEQSQDQYVVKNAYKKPTLLRKFMPLSHFAKILPCEEILTKDGQILAQGVSFLNEKVVSLILQNYSKLKQNSYDDFLSDTWYLMQDFDQLCKETFANFPLYNKLIECKIDGLSNAQIQKILFNDFGISYTPEYLSNLWRNKIPKKIVTRAKEKFLYLYFQEHNLPMKQCSKCGKYKPAHLHFYSKNKTSKDKWYSICKACRTKRKENN